jgi:hypothetical protein
MRPSGLSPDLMELKCLHSCPPLACPSKACLGLPVDSHPCPRHHPRAFLDLCAHKIGVLTRTTRVPAAVLGLPRHSVLTTLL